MLMVYRTAYGLVVVIFLGNIIKLGCSPAAFGSASPLLIPVLLSLCSLLALVIGFTRIRPLMFWSLVFLWIALFGWYGWFSSASPFVLHEIHSLDPMKAAREGQTHRLVAGGVFIALSLWFLSLPIARSLYERQRRSG